MSILYILFQDLLIKILTFFSLKKRKIKKKSLKSYYIYILKIKLFEFISDH